MVSPPPVRSLLALLVALVAPAACGSPPDTEARPELEELYGFLYDEAEDLFGRDLRESDDEADRLARDRLVSAANSLADEAAENPRPSYEIDLPHLNVPEETPGWDTPLDFEITVTAEELAELGVPGVSGVSGVP